MPKKEAIFIFTKDRHKILKKTLDSIQSTPYVKYIIDDSVTLTNRFRVLKLCKESDTCIYLGKAEFNQFILQCKIDLSEFSFLLKEVGAIGWNLGYARNFALLYSKCLGLDKALFMDDDIEVKSAFIIDELFNQLDDYKFVGANICQMTDHSIIEHIALDIDIINETMLSGGFMCFNPQRINHYFLNIYNEDWIWIYFQLKNEKYLQTGNVYQSMTDLFQKYEERILFQEFGEIVIDGILEVFKESSMDLLTQHSFWARMLSERKEYLSELLKKAENKNKKEYIKIIKYIKANFRIFKANMFHDLFEKYFSDRIRFQRLYNSLP